MPRQFSKQSLKLIVGNGKPANKQRLSINMADASTKSSKNLKLNNIFLRFKRNPLNFFYSFISARACEPVSRPCKSNFKKNKILGQNYSWKL